MTGAIECKTMGLIFLIVAGSVLGWLATFLTAAQTLRDAPVNMLVGMGGALLAGLVISPRIGGGTLIRGDYGISTMIIAIIGAAIMLAITHYVRSRELL